MNEHCLGEPNCVGYNFESMDNEEDYDPLNGANYKTSAFHFVTNGSSGNEGLIQAAVDYYRMNKGWNIKHAKETIFEKTQNNNGTSGMVLKVVDCQRIRTCRFN